MNWTEADVARRNAEVLGESAPAAAPLSEAELRKQCEILLENWDWRLIRMEPVADRSRGRGFGTPGMPDLLALRYDSAGRADVLWVEWKRKGAKARAHQKAWHGRERSRGARTVICGEDFPASIHGFISWYKANYITES